MNELSAGLRWQFIILVDYFISYTGEMANVDKKAVSDAYEDVRNDHTETEWYVESA